MTTSSQLRGRGLGQTIVGRVSLNRLSRPGDVLVCRMTDPTMLTDIMQASAVVTDEGGVLCHAAIICTEMGIPYVVGTQEATLTLKDGDTVEVNPSAGIVTVL